MHPSLAHSLPAYLAAWLCAGVVGVAVGFIWAARHGFPARRTVLALLCAVVTILAGSKILYLLESQLYPADDYVPVVLRGSLHGFRIPGGMLLLALATPPVCRTLGLPWRRFGDLLIPLAAGALVLIRLGCFLNGCCFGKVSSLPWSVRFPRGTWAFLYHRERGWIGASATHSLPVHPLQLYFVAAAVFTLMVLLWRSRHEPQPGSLQLLFYALFFVSTALIEPLRQNFLTLNNYLVLPAGILFTVLLIYFSAMGRVSSYHQRTIYRCR